MTLHFTRSPEALDDFFGCSRLPAPGWPVASGQSVPSSSLRNASSTSVVVRGAGGVVLVDLERL
ncbi:hypothetical protein ABZY05_38360 [Streptomyces canus]|uniref:hypothetical protein n=1 Tax=Streptomyces canus TaxID=58343 RepID=UPI00339E3CE7